ncbi:hypothetical protein FHS27_005035 [Rhodopirellula rubra]|uniref:Uncharacterized protein n=1 Tax=Aporhodopirellula rubra TaxID=980271 RepID=A0A7W5H729_9BACT|nr:hypothetical protein [Aporhodopirellula rubra]
MIVIDARSDDSSATSHHQADHEQDQKYDKTDLRYGSGGAGDHAEAEDASN